MHSRQEEDLQLGRRSCWRDRPPSSPASLPTASFSADIGRRLHDSSPENAAFVRPGPFPWLAVDGRQLAEQGKPVEVMGERGREKGMRPSTFGPNTRSTAKTDTH